MYLRWFCSPNLDSLYGADAGLLDEWCLLATLVFALPDLLVHPLGGLCLLGSMECLWSCDMICLLVVTAGVHEDHNGLCTTISEASTLPDLTTVLVAVASLAIDWPGWWLSQSKNLQVWNPALDFGTSCVSTWFSRVVI